MQALAALEALAQCDRELRPRDIGVTCDAAGEAEALVQGLEAIGEVALELLGAAQVLDASRAALRGGGEAAAQGHEPRPVARQVGVEGVAMQVDRAPGHEPVVERDRPPVETQREHCEAALVGELRQRRPLEALPLGQAEGRAVGPPLPAHVVQREGVGQVSQHGLAGRGERRLEAAELAQLALAAAILVAAVRARVALVGVLPAVGHVGHGRLDALHDAHARAGGRGQHAVGRQAEHVQRLHARARQRGEQLAGRLGRLARSEHDVAERRFVRAREHRDARAPGLPQCERREADELTCALGDDDVRLAREGRLGEPGAHPGREEVRARARHGLDQRVPRGIELSEAINVGQRANPQRRGSEWSHRLST